MIDFFRHYKGGFLFPDTLWVQCNLCSSTIFTWREDSGFNVGLLVEAIVRHESVWHASEPD